MLSDYLGFNSFQELEILLPDSRREEMYERGKEFQFLPGIRDSSTKSDRGDDDRVRD